MSTVVPNHFSFCTPKEACNKLGVHIDTLRNWDKKHLIATVRTEGGHRRYLIDPDGRRPVPPEQVEKTEGNNSSRRDYIYCRVSTQHQKEDLKRQVQNMQEKHPYTEVVTDIASGLNFKRKGN